MYDDCVTLSNVLLKELRPLKNEYEPVDAESLLRESWYFKSLVLML